MIDINCLLAQLDRVAWLETTIQAGAETLILNSGHSVALTISWLWHTRATIHHAQDSSDGAYLLPYDLDQHPLPPPPVKLPVKDALPGAKIETAVCHGDHNLAAHHLPLQMGIIVVLAGASPGGFPQPFHVAQRRSAEESFVLPIEV